MFDMSEAVNPSFLFPFPTRGVPGILDIHVRYHYHFATLVFSRKAVSSTPWL
jgi:hypothetical protein